MSRRVVWTLVYVVTFGPFAVWRATEADWWTVATTTLFGASGVVHVWRPLE